MGGLGFFVLVSVLSPGGQEMVLESKVQTLSGLFERWRDAEDERHFLVQLTAHGQTQIVQDFRRPADQDSQTTRVGFGFRQGRPESETVLVREGSKWGILGESTRIFEFSRCRALGYIEVPTPLGEREVLTFRNLECVDPLPTKSSEVTVIGRRSQHWLECQTEPEEDGGGLCHWQPRDESQREAIVQLAAFGHIVRSQGALFLSGIDAFLPPLTAESWAFDANYSSYDGYEKRLLFGGGQYPDARDGFIVSHEWTHFLVDQLNPGLIGYEARGLHEAFADFFAANLYQSPCIAPYDAQEEGLACLRDLKEVRRYPEDMVGGAPHEISLIISSALWRARELIPPPLMTELIVETVIQLKKYATYQKTWEIFLQNYARMIARRPLLKNRLEDVIAIGQDHGLGAASHSHPTMVR